MIRVLLLKNHALILIVAASLVSLLPAPGSGPSANGDVKSVEQYRQFATLRDGEAARGQKLFADEQSLGCTKCHSLDGRGTKAGPDLLTVGDQFTRRDLIEAVLVPSATIAVGYSMTVVETKSEDEYQGVLKQATDDWIELAGADSQRIRIPTSDIKERRGSNISLMPEGLQAALSLQEFTDLIDYLVSLKQPANSRITYRGMPDLI